MERAGIETVNLLTEKTAADSSIIEFDPKSRAASDRR
jgi:hypothetical protein